MSYLLVSDESPVVLTGAIDASGRLQLLHHTGPLADHGDSLQVEHEGIVRIELQDFSNAGHVWSMAASHDGGAGPVAWSRGRDRAYHDFGQVYQAHWLSIGTEARCAGSSQTKRCTWMFSARPTGGLADSLPSAAGEPEAAYAVPRVSHPSWLPSMYELVARQSIDAAIDVLFDHMNDLLFADRCAECDDLLQIIDIERLDTNLLVALLSVTAPARAVLPSRPRLVLKVEARLRALAPERVEKLMSGLR